MPYLQMLIIYPSKHLGGGGETRQICRAKYISKDGISHCTSKQRWTQPLKAAAAAEVLNGAKAADTDNANEELLVKPETDELSAVRAGRLDRWTSHTRKVQIRTKSVNSSMFVTVTPSCHQTVLE